MMESFSKSRYYDYSWIGFLNKVPKGNIFLFLGADYTIHQRLLNKALKEYKISLPEFNFRRFEKNTVEELIELTYEYPVMDEKKIIYVRDLGAFDKSSQERLAGCLEGLKDFCVIFFSYYQRTTRDLSSRLTGVFERLAVKVNLSLTEANFINYVKDFLKQNKKSIEQTALKQLWINSAGEFSFIQNELEKLISYTLDKDVIAEIDVIKAGSRNIDVKVYEITSFIAKRNQKVALDILNDLQITGEEALKILGYLNSQFIFLAKIKSFLDKNNIDKVYAEFSKENSYRLKKALEEVKFFSLDRLIRSLNILKRADIKIKTEQASWLILELTVLQLCKIP